MTQDLKRSPGARAGVWAAALVGPASIAIFGLSVADHSNAVAICLGLAAASFVAAGLLGFLFGVPRRSATDTPAINGLSYLPNTNLEQVSDWLTKILLGATLTQIGDIADWFGSRFSEIGKSIGGGDAGPVFAALLTLYFASAGFLAGWLVTRLFLGRLMQEADDRTKALGQLANEVESTGEPELAEEIRSAAISPILAAEYLRIRSSDPASWERTRLLEANYRANMRAARANKSLGRSDAVEAFNSGTDGNRIAALAYMEARDDLLDMDVVVRAIEEPASAFEQYHALAIAEKRLRQTPPLDEATAGALSAAIDAGYESGRFEGSHDRQALAVQIRGHLNSM